jgi:DNA-binding NtrC family response regulator
MTPGAVPRMRVLIVDDEVAILETFRRAFRRDFEIQLAATGAQALDLLEAHEFELVLADYAMAGMDGVTLLKRVAELRPAMVRVLVTAQHTITEVTDALRDGLVAHVIPKPWVRADVLSAVSAITSDVR